MTEWEARGRLPGEPVAIVDIGSNSVRLVAYESLTRAPTPIFNEKVLCGLGRGVATTGFLADDSVAKALAALQRFRVLCRTMEHRATCAPWRPPPCATPPTARSSSSWRNGRSAARSSCLSGAREAQLSALGVVVFDPRARRRRRRSRRRLAGVDRRPSGARSAAA